MFPKVSNLPTVLNGSAFASPQTTIIISPTMALKMLRYTVFGKVQGVFFRDSAQDKARSLRLAGWVQNNQDGTVGGEAIGEPQNIDKLCVSRKSSFTNMFSTLLLLNSQEWLKVGPSQAKVEDVKVDVRDVDNNHFEGVFEKRRGRGNSWPVSFQE